VAQAAPGPNQSPGTNELIPVRGLHLSAPAKKDLGTALAFIREALPKERVNTLILEFDFNYDFRARPEFANPSALSKDEVQQIAKTCRDNGIELIPQINCLGHQSWSRRNGRLLEKHPEFDETPGKYPNNEGIYCRSYCPLHPEVHAVLFDLIDELARACDAKAFHVGMDEVFILADPDRYAQPTGVEKFAVSPFLCVRCGHTVSVLPPNRLTYRPLPVHRLQGAFDAQAKVRHYETTAESAEAWLHIAMIGIMLRRLA
jgi:hypothetical protein